MAAVSTTHFEYTCNCRPGDIEGKVAVSTTHFEYTCNAEIKAELSNLAVSTTHFEYTCNNPKFQHRFNMLYLPLILSTPATAGE